MAIQVVRDYSVYVDESIQNRHGKEVIAVTAYVATFARWLALEEEWRRILDHFGVPAFHMTDFIARKGDFENDWSDEKRDNFIWRLATAAVENTVMGVGCGIVRDDYEKAFSPELQHVWKDPYYFCLWACLALMLEAGNYPIEIPRPLHFLIERRPKFIGNAIDLFYQTKDRLDKEGRFGEAAAGLKSDHIPIQAADLLVYEATRHLVEIEHDPAWGFRKSFDLLRSKRNLVIAYPREPELRKYVEFLQENAISSSSSSNVS